MADISFLRSERMALIGHLVARPSGVVWCSLHSDLADRVLQEVYQEVVSSQGSPPRLCLVATGGYGRRELSPYSDLDLAVVPLDDTHPGLDQLIRLLFMGIQRGVGEGLGLKVGYSFRSLPELPGVDAPTRTALLDARLVAGSQEAFEALQEGLWDDFPAADFILAKVREREHALRRWHDTPLVTQPHLKEGAGGLRSFHAANWVRMALGERPARPGASYDRVLRARNLLHAAAQRPQEELTLEKRLWAAEKLGQPPLDFASRLSESMLALEAVWQESLSRIPESRFGLTRHCLALRGEVRVGPEATAGEAALAVALGVGLGIRPPSTPSRFDAAAKSPEAVVVIGWGEKVLRAFDQAGILGALLPELEACRHLMPRDSSHKYSVFEHTLRTIRALESLPPGSYLGDLRSSQRDTSLLCLALLLHDVGKADPSREHSISGAEAAERVCSRWGLSRPETDLVVWLVREHLAMARFIRMRDVQNPATVHEFALFVETEARLDLLTLLTYADVNAVSEDAWTPVQQAYLEHLHRSAWAVIAEQMPVPDPAAARERLKRHLMKQPVDKEDVADFLRFMPATYVFSTPPERAAEHWQMLQLVPSEGVAIRWADQRQLGFTDFTICTNDKPGLFSQILAVFYAHDLRLHSVRASTSTGTSPVAVDVVSASYGDRLVPPSVAAKVAEDLSKVIRGEVGSDTLLAATGKDPDRRQEIFNWTWQQGNPGILEVRAPRGRGMAYRLSKLIARQGWDIEGARVAQWAGQGAASFSITGPDRRELTVQDLEEVLPRSSPAGRGAGL